MDQDICRINGCANPVKIIQQQLCAKHYSRLRRTGDPLGVRQSPVTLFEDRFWPKVDKLGPYPTNPFQPVKGRCWIWTAYMQPNGYGLVGRGRRGTGMEYVHRAAYELMIGPIPEGLELDHLCRVRRCVNPDHLEPVTRAINNERSDSLSAQRSRQTHCVYGHPLTEDNITRRRGRRDCLICEQRRSLDRTRRARR